MVMRWLTRLRQSRSNAASDSEKCWICGAATPELLVPEVYRCRACNRVQGEGAAAFLSAERHRQIAALPLEARLARASSALKEAELAIIACEGELTTALRLAEACLHDEDDTRREEASSRLASALLRFGQIEDLLNDTAIALNLPLEQRSTSKSPRAWPAAELLADAQSALLRVADLHARRSHLKATLGWQSDKP